MYEAQVTSQFSAAHHLLDYAGDCARLHGHNWEVTVSLQAQTLDSQGISVDFRKIKNCLTNLLQEFDHSEINQHPDFKNANPTSENLARYFYQRLSSEINDDRVRISRVQVAENPDSCAAYFEQSAQ